MKLFPKIIFSLNKLVNFKYIIQFFIFLFRTNVNVKKVYKNAYIEHILVHKNLGQ